MNRLTDYPARCHHNFMADQCLHCKLEKAAEENGRLREQELMRFREACRLKACLLFESACVIVLALIVLFGR